MPGLPNACRARLRHGRSLRLVFAAAAACLARPEISAAAEADQGAQPVATVTADAPSVADAVGASGDVSVPTVAAPGAVRTFGGSGPDFGMVVFRSHLDPIPDEPSAHIGPPSAPAPRLALAAGLQQFGDGVAEPQAAAEWTRRSGEATLAASTHYLRTELPDSGSGDRLRYYPDGSLKESAVFDSRHIASRFGLAASVQVDEADRAYRVYGGLSREADLDREPLERTTTIDGRSFGRRLTENRRAERHYEIGGDYAQMLTDTLSGRLTISHRQAYAKEKKASTQTTAPSSGETVEDWNETMAGAGLSQRSASGLLLESGVEVASAFLAADTSILSNGAPLNLPNSDARARERRMEVFAVADWGQTRALGLRVRLGVQAYRIDESGASSPMPGHAFAKPDLRLTYRPGWDTEVRLRLGRQVHLLEFRNFIATADFSGGSVTAGGVDLTPEHVWTYQVAVEKRFAGQGTAGLTYTHEAVDNVIDRKPLAGVYDAIGNIGPGRRDRIEASLAVPLDWLRLGGATLSTTATWRWSEVVDAMTGVRRRISGESPFSGGLRFSQRLDRLSSTWGVDGRFGSTRTSYRFAEIRRQSEDARWSLYWDWRPDPTLSIRLDAENLNGGEQRRTRTRFVGPRNDGVLLDVEVKRSAFDPYVSLLVRKAL